MKRIAFIFLLTLMVSVGSADAQQFIVRPVYFQPTDAPAPSDRIADLMLEVQRLLPCRNGASGLRRENLPPRKRRERQPQVFIL